MGIIHFIRKLASKAALLVLQYLHRQKEKEKETAEEQIRRRRAEDEAYRAKEKEKAERVSHWQAKYEKARKQCSAYGKVENCRKNRHYRRTRTSAR